MFGADWWALGVIVYEMLCGFTPYTEHGNVVNEMQICRNITNPDFSFAFPSWLGARSKDLVMRLLTRDAVERLGCGGGGVRDVMAHPLYETMDFEQLLCKQVQPPSLPSIASAEDTSNFEDADDIGAGLVDIAAEGRYLDDPHSFDFYL